MFTVLRLDPGNKDSVGNLLYSILMHLFINGDEKTFGGPLSLAELIEQLGMKGDRVAVELNRAIVARAVGGDEAQRRRPAGDSAFRRRGLGEQRVDNDPMAQPSASLGGLSVTQRTGVGG